eukprot:jgi/Hompol1/5469/HPOL_004464-RA
MVDKKLGSLPRQLIRIIQQFHSQLDDDALSSPAKWSLDAIIEYALRIDVSLRRKPQKNVLTACEQAVAFLRKNQENDEHDNDSEDSFEQFEPDVPLVEVQPTNFLNRSLVGIYQKQAAAAQQPASPVKQQTKRSTTASSTSISADGDGTNGIDREQATESTSANLAAQALTDPDAKLLKRKSKAASVKSESKKSKTAESKWPMPVARLTDLGGIDQISEDLMQLIVMPLKHPEIYRHLGIDPPRGILLHGPPGCGKTMLANAIAGEAGVPFISIAAPVVVSGMSGESEKKIREVFDEAKELAPCILFIDEIDAITPKRETAQREMERRIVAQLLTCMDDVAPEKTDFKPVMIIGATNRPDSLDPALRRAGRFDREIAMGVPDENARMRILQKLSAKLRLDGNLDFRLLAKLTPGYVGADLNALTAEAGLIAVRRIFESIGLGSKQPESDDMAVDMEAEPDDTETQILSVVKSGIENLMTSRISISQFMEIHPEPLTEEELEPLCIRVSDFQEALKKVQPSSKREGFATVPDVTWEDIGALSSVREELRMAVVEPIRHPEVFQRVGIVSPTGVLLYGPPGCGKTLLAKAVANESHCNFISVKGPELLNKYVGESERAVRMVFARAQASCPCVIFFDELDALCPSRSNEAESQSSSRLVNTLLTEMDGMQGRKQVFVIAATNRPDMIDPAMLRPGRLDKALYVDLPNASERIEILKTLTRKTPIASTLNLESIANDERCDGLSGADLASLVREAAVAALRSTLYKHSASLSADELGSNHMQSSIFVGVEHFRTAFARVSPSVHKKDRRRYELLKVKFGSSSLSSSSQDAPASSEQNQ